MTNGKYFLKQNIQVEPLINRWYAWIQIIPPANAAFNIVKRHLETMSSYINSPMMHAAAVKDPTMRGGPFIDLDGGRVDEMRSLITETKEKAKHLVSFTDAVKDLEKLMKDKAKGYSMEPLYAEVPEILRGYVELFYDLNGNPSYRFFEAFLYKSDFYCKSFQSISLSEILQDNDRPFIFTTPRLPDKNTVDLPVPFCHMGLDELFKMKKVPQTLDYIINQLGVDIDNRDVFDSFFTTEVPPAYKKYTGDHFRIRYFGHACILIETKDVTILLDPVLSYTYESDTSRYTYLDLPDQIDYVLITHSHHDHILIETMLQIRHKVKQIIVGRNIDGSLLDPSLKLLLTNIGFKNVVEIRDLEEITFEGGSITGIPFLGEHHDLSILSKTCYFIQIGNKKIFSVADSCNIEPRLYEKVHQFIGDIDVLFLGMECDGAPVSWVYGPLFNGPIPRDKDYSRRGRGCNFQEGIELVRRFNCKEVYVYAMGAEPWVRHILDVVYTETSNPIIESNKLIEVSRIEGIVADRLFAEREIILK
jgi:L-ascorbate metabolism protein UlaG (beta-lactamase superfamily)